MCGRYADFLEMQDLLDVFAIASDAQDARLMPPSFNVAPLQTVRVIRTVTGGATSEGAGTAPDGRRLETARWGLVPTWAKDTTGAARLLNARVETVAEKPSFRTALAKRRCIVPASGYYEWQAGTGGKTPYFIHPADGSPLAMAGLLEVWRAGVEAPWLVTCAIVTTAARGDMRDIHDRQPVMMTEDSWATWLDPGAARDEVLAAAAAPAPALAWHAVGAAVGNVRNNGPHLIEPSPSAT